MYPPPRQVNRTKVLVLCGRKKSWNRPLYFQWVTPVRRDIYAGKKPSRWARGRARQDQTRGEYLPGTGFGMSQERRRPVNSRRSHSARSWLWKGSCWPFRTSGIPEVAKWALDHNGTRNFRSVRETTTAGRTFAPAKSVKGNGVRTTVPRLNGIGPSNRSHYRCPPAGRPGN